METKNQKERLEIKQTNRNNAFGLIDGVDVNEESVSLKCQKRLPKLKYKGKNEKDRTEYHNVRTITDSVTCT